jgi:spermidine synthase
VIQRAAARLLMAASGFAALGYQIVWTEQCSLWLGHEAAAMLAVVAAFFGGLSLGGLALGARIEKSADPRRWYVGAEIAIGLWSLLVAASWSPFGAAVQQMTGVAPSAGWQWTVAFTSTFLLFLPATAAMGATLPAMERLTGELRCTRSISALYAWNTAGALLGVLAISFAVIPGLGLLQGSVICAGLNLLCAALALAVFPRSAAVARARDADRDRARAALGRLALTGFLGIGYEVLVVRVLSQVTEDTVYTFALLLAVYLLGSAAGAAAYHRWLERKHDADALGDWLFAALATACLLGAASLWGAESARAAASGFFGASFAGAVAAEAALAAMAFTLPTLVMGALFSHLSGVALGAGVSFGRATGINLAAGAVAPALCGVIAVPALGSKLALVLVGAGYCLGLTRAAWRSAKTWLPALCALGLASFAPPLRFVDVPERGKVVDYREGVMAAVSVTEDADGTLRLRINNRQQEGSNVTRHVDARQAWLPLLLRPEPRRALFLGLGTGVTASAATLDPALEVDAVELLPEVIVMSPRFLGDGEPSRLHVLAADARRYVRASERSYDVIVADNFHPARSGSGALYTVEHFRSIRARLTQGGVFCQWLPLHQLDSTTLRSIVGSFVAVYPGGGALLASNSLETPVLGLVTRGDDAKFDARTVRAGLSQPARERAFAGLGLEDEFAVLGAFVAGPAALARFAGAARLNTENHPVVSYSAPRITYAPDSSPADRLIELLAELSLDVGELFAPRDPDWERRLAAYWNARDRYLAAGRGVRPSERVEVMLAQVQGPLLGVLRTSPDFRPAYDPLLAMAGALSRSNLEGARALLSELSRIQPARDEAPRLLSRLNDAVVAHGGAP